MRTITRKKLPLYADLSEGYSDEPSTVEAIHRKTDFWTIALFLAVLGIFLSAWANYAGWLESPNQQLAQDNAELSAQLSATNSRLEKIEACLQ